MIVNIHSTPNGKMLAICDKNLLGKTFEEGELQLDLSTRFYQGEDMPDDLLAELVKEARIINAVGEESVRFLREHKLIEDSNTQKIAGIPHAQCVIDR